MLTMLSMIVEQVDIVVTTRGSMEVVANFHTIQTSLGRNFVEKDFGVQLHNRVGALLLVSMVFFGP